MTQTVQRLTADEVATRAGVSVDTHGIRFEHDGVILRALRGDDATFFRGLLESPKLEGCFDAGLVRFSTSDLAVEGYDLVLEAQRVPIVTYPQEWPTAMLHEVGLTIARLGRALADLRAGLQDAHPWNVLFDSTRAIWIDIGSVVPARPISDAWVNEFRRHIAVPLELRARGWHSLADLVWRDHPGTGVKALLERGRLRDVFPWRMRRTARGSRDPVKFFGALESYMEDLRPSDRSGEWSNYVQAPGAQAGQRDSYDAKQRAVDEYLARLTPAWVLDVGANAGWFSELAAWHGHLVIALDPDDAALGQLFQRVRRERLPILPLRLDVMWPTGSHGLALGHAAAPDRLRADTTMWLALLHHLVGRQGYSFETVSKVIDAFTKRTAIIEFVPAEDAHVRHWPIAAEPWYDVDHFIAAMRPYFPYVEVLPSSPEPRLMLQFQRQSS
ncbi:hypothetical protein BH24CHL9_BH24CHL9_11970 [soil metagenome]